MSRYAVVLRKELTEQWRTMRLPSTLALFAFLGIASPAFARYAKEIVSAIGGAQFSGLIPAPTVADSYAQFAKNLGQLGAALAIIIAMGSVSMERDRGTLGFLLSKPVSRAAFLSAKLLAIAGSLATGLLLAAALTYVYTTVLFATPGAAFGLLAALALLELLVFASLTFAASTVTRSTVAAGGVGVLFLIVLGALSIIPGAGAYTPQGMVSRGMVVMHSGDFGSLIGPVILQLGLIAAAFLAAILALRQQEI